MTSALTSSMCPMIILWKPFESSTPRLELECELWIWNEFSEKVGWKLKGRSMKVE